MTRNLSKRQRDPFDRFERVFDIALVIGILSTLASIAVTGVIIWAIIHLVSQV